MRLLGKCHRIGRIAGGVILPSSENVSRTARFEGPGGMSVPPQDHILKYFFSVCEVAVVYSSCGSV